ncbi:hypothetical protein AB0F49_03170 [Micromonospora ureilytica]|uniref:VMAP-C domain-containing protein n=1 Tax=Micromonospora ureilytica TaxID=709868 RepID=UPI0034032CCB
MTSPRPDDIRQDIEDELVEVLAAIRSMQQPSSRRQLVETFRRRAKGRVEVDDHDSPRRQAVALAAACITAPHLLTTLGGVVALLEPGADARHALERIRYEIEASDLLNSNEWSELRPLLLAVTLASMDRFLQQASAHRVDSLPAWCSNAWDAFVFLIGHNSPPSGLPSDMAFLALVEREVSPPVAESIRHRNQRVARRLGLTADLEQRRVAVNEGSGQPERYVYLVIQIEPDLEPGSDRYSVSYYRQWHGGQAWYSRRQGQFVEIPYQRLESTIEEIVRTMETSWSGQRSDVAVELVLPKELLNEDIAWWRKEQATEDLDQKVLAMDYPVVIRSLDRLRRPEWHGEWERRWRRLGTEPSLTRVYHSKPSGSDYHTRMEADLSDDPYYTALLLSEPPTVTNASGMKEVMTGLRAGLPVIVWHRTKPANAQLWQEIRDLTAAGGITDLPARLRRSRLAALKLEPGQRDLHHGRHLVVLWDDPTRTPEPRSIDDMGVDP